jgi:hypothetical protein
VVVVVFEPSQPTPNTTTASRREFARVVAPLEHATGRRLGNPYRQVCLDAFARFPAGVRAVACASLEDARSNPLGLFIWRIRNGWHELEPVKRLGENVKIPDNRPDEPGAPTPEEAPRKIPDNRPDEPGAPTPEEASREVPPEAQELLERLRRGTLVQEMPAC